MSDVTVEPTLFLNGRVRLHAGDCFAVLDALPEASVDSVVTDPPYHLTSIVKRFGAADAAAAKDYTGERDNATGAYARASRGFMGKQWDGGDIAFQPELWAKVLRVLKPGGHVVAFSGTRTYHRMAVAIEDAGFEIRDQLAWAYGSGFPKSHDVSKGIDKAAGAIRELVEEHVNRSTFDPESQGGGGFQRGTIQITRPATDAARTWQGWGTALKPAWEPICLARKPLIGTVAENVLAQGVGALNINGCRVEMSAADQASALAAMPAWNRSYPPGESKKSLSLSGGADGSLHNRDRTQYDPSKGRWPANFVHDGSDEVLAGFPDAGDDSGSAARYFYTAKADAEDRLGSKHPTVKPVDLMRWLVRLVTPKGGTVLDPFAGTGTTGHAAFLEGFSAVLIEREAEYRDDIAQRMALAMAGPVARKAAIAKPATPDIGGLFAALGEAGA